MTGDGLLSDVDLVQRFESLGDNCELGLVQRRVGAEPLGLLRFAGAPLPHLLEALRARFDGIAVGDSIRIDPVNDEYMVELTRYGLNYHADVKIGEADPVALHAQQVKTVGFLAEKLIRDLENPDKILVFRQNEPLSANDLIDLRRAVAAYGPSVLLWVQEARPGHPAGSVVIADETLMVGYVSRLAPRHHVPDIDLASWVTMLRRAYAVRPSPRSMRDAVRPPEPEPPSRIDVVFGTEGNAFGQMGQGWSGQENGFCWSVDDSSTLTLPRIRPSDSYRLEMDVVPFIAPPALESQRMEVLVNGKIVSSFDPLPRGVVACAVPGRLVRDAQGIEVVLRHPDALSPRAASGQNDDRRLAVAFRTVSLIGVEECQRSRSG
jgi:hypothetical protein